MDENVRKITELAASTTDRKSVSVGQFDLPSRATEQTSSTSQQSPPACRPPTFCARRCNKGKRGWLVPCKCPELRPPGSAEPPPSPLPAACASRALLHGPALRKHQFCLS